MSIYISEIDIPRPGHLGGGNWHLDGLADITILFGKNSSGKSLLLRAWRDQHVEASHYVAPERTGEMTFEPGQITTQMNPEGRRGQSQRNYSANYRQQVITRITTYFAIRGDHRGDQPPAGDPDEIERYLSLLIPDFSISISASSAPPYELLRLDSDQKVGGVQDLSSGEAQILTIGLDIITIAAIWDLELKKNRILLLDEPEAHIHPDLQTRFGDFISQVASRFALQVVIATHSTTLLASVGQTSSGQASVIYLDRARDQFKARLFDSVQRELAACLGGHALMGPLFGAPILLVEGDDDSRIWSQVPRHHVLSVSVIPCHGDEIRKYQKTLEQIFQSMADPADRHYGFALLDGDVSLPQPNPDNPQQFVKFIQLRCREAENLYLSDEVLGDLGQNWQEAKERITTSSNEYGEKAQLLSKANSWDRRNEDLKTVIKEISRILDPKNVDWTIRVGRSIGRNRPSGQLASFLGESVLNSLWGEEIAEKKNEGA